MTRVTIALPEPLADAVKAAAGDNVSAWLAQLARRELLAMAVRAEQEHDRADPDYLAWREERQREVEGPVE